MRNFFILLFQINLVRLVSFTGAAGRLGLVGFAGHFFITSRTARSSGDRVRRWPISIAFSISMSDRRRNLQLPIHLWVQHSRIWTPTPPPSINQTTAIGKFDHATPRPFADEWSGARLRGKYTEKILEDGFFVKNSCHRGRRWAVRISRRRIIRTEII